MSATPHINHPVTISDEEQQAAADYARQIRKQRDAARAANAPARKAAIETGPELRDIDAAVDCHCGCHPRPAERTLHEGGTTCPCQMTPEERTVALEQLFATLEQLAELDDENDERQQQIAHEAARLGVELTHCGGGAPFVIRGHVDGRGFFLRERHDLWRVEIAPDQTPNIDPWTAARDVPTITVAYGDSSELDQNGRFDPAHALRVAVDAVRLFLQRRSCPHTNAARFCPACGVEVEHADEWRIGT